MAGRWAPFPDSFDGPALTQAQVGGQLGGAEERASEAWGECLGPGAEGKGVGACHSRAVPGDVAAR